MEYGPGVALFDGIEDRAIPDIDPVLKTDITDNQNQQRYRKQPGQRVAVFAPKALGADPEPGQQIIFARLLGLQGRSVRIGVNKFRRWWLDETSILSNHLHDRRLI